MKGDSLTGCVCGCCRKGGWGVFDDHIQGYQAGMGGYAGPPSKYYHGGQSHSIFKIMLFVLTVVMISLMLCIISLEVKRCLPNVSHNISVRLPVVLGKQAGVDVPHRFRLPAPSIWAPE